MAEPIVDYMVTPHAAFEMERRAVADEMLRRVLGEPE